MEDIEITKNNLKEIRYEDVMFVAYAEGGAMGEPGQIRILLKDFKVYHTNYCYSEEIEIEDLFPVFPPLKTFQSGFGMVDYLDEGWKWIYMGFGNYLLVRENLFQEYIKYLEPEVKNERYTAGAVYRKWLDVAIEMMKNNVK